MHQQPTRSRRAAFSFLEVQVAFVLLGIALAGLFPLVVIYSRQLRNMEGRFSPGTTYYLAPPSDPWARKLGAAAQLTQQDPGAAASPPVLVIDNADGGYSESGAGWQSETNPNAFQGTDRTHPAGTGTNMAAWQFTGLQPGWYDVRATWPARGDRATNATYSIFDSAVARGSFTCDQTQTPVGAVYQGRPWQSLATVAVRGTSLQVVLSDQANGTVAADAVRIIPVRNLVQVLTLNRALTTDAVTAQVSVTVVTPQ
jgi:hypothetical protein